ncbi:hypothetical protein [Komagataeibacter xylinus]|uniref:hypothetical protein n=1 Tax=Komagataeibacter xylinus TaxID=28448 RepID=UPI001F5E808D|nr:hypothetical protein [Komagataeibacter xylinus]
MFDLLADRRFGELGATGDEFTLDTDWLAWIAVAPADQIDAEISQKGCTSG